VVCGLDSLAQDKVQWRTPVDIVMNLRLQYEVGNFLTSWKSVCWSRIPLSAVRKGWKTEKAWIRNRILVWPSRNYYINEWIRSIIIIIIVVVVFQGLGLLACSCFRTHFSETYESIWTVGRTLWTGISPTQGWIRSKGGIFFLVIILLNRGAWRFCSSVFCIRETLHDLWETGGNVQATHRYVKGGGLGEVKLVFIASRSITHAETVPSSGGDFSPAIRLREWNSVSKK